LLDFLHGILEGKETVRDVEVAAVDAKTGAYVKMNPATEFLQGDFAKAVLASASIEFIFPTTNVGNYMFLDGSVAWNNNMISAIDRCRKKVGNDDSKITLDVIVLSNWELGQGAVSKNAYENHLRYKEIQDYYSEVSDIVKFMDSTPKVNFRYLFKPTSDLVTNTLYMLDFNPSNEDPMIDLGKKDAEDTIKKGPGYYFEELRRHMHEGLWD
jgi:prepilin-type processing-associated H-X9-DG protein